MCGKFECSPIRKSMGFFIPYLGRSQLSRSAGEGKVNTWAELAQGVFFLYQKGVHQRPVWWRFVSLETSGVEQLPWCVLAQLVMWYSFFCRGTDELLGVMDKVTIINSTLGKALGGAAGEGISLLKDLHMLKSSTASL